MPIIDKKDSALLLEGGASRGVFTAGALDFLIDEDFYFPYVCGVSAGACNAINYAARQKGRTKDCMITQDKKYSYFNMHALIKEHSVFDMDMIFDEFANEVYPYDYETYFHSDIRCDLAVTSVRSGKAEFKDDRSDGKRLMNICRASSSIPLFSPMVKLDGGYYVDGGIADSVPIAHVLRSGRRRCAVILTRNLGYRKSPPAAAVRNLYEMTLKKYPNLLYALLTRYRSYNREMEVIEKWEREGRIFVLRPQLTPVKRTEGDYTKLTEFYQHGYDMMKENFGKMKEYLGC